MKKTSETPGTPGERQRMSEFGLINRLAAFGVADNLKHSDSVLTGIGDDTAVVSTPSGEMLLTTDAIVSNTGQHQSDFSTS